MLPAKETYFLSLTVILEVFKPSSAPSWWPILRKGPESAGYLSRSRTFGTQTVQMLIPTEYDASSEISCLFSSGLWTFGTMHSDKNNPNICSVLPQWAQHGMITHSSAITLAFASMSRISPQNTYWAMKLWFWSKMWTGHVPDFVGFTVIAHKPHNRGLYLL